MFLLHRFFLLWVVLSASQNGPDSTRYSVALPVERRGNDSSAPSAGTPAVGSWCGWLTRLTRPATGWLRLRVRRATTARGQPSRPSSRRGGAWRPGSAKPPTQRQPPATCRRGGRPRTHTWTPFCPMVCSRPRAMGPAVDPSTPPPPPRCRAQHRPSHWLATQRNGGRRRLPDDARKSVMTTPVTRRSGWQGRQATCDLTCRGGGGENPQLGTPPAAGRGHRCATGACMWHRPMKSSRAARPTGSTLRA